MHCSKQEHRFSSSFPTGFNRCQECGLPSGLAETLGLAEPSCAAVIAVRNSHDWKCVEPDHPEWDETLGPLYEPSMEPRPMIRVVCRNCGMVGRMTDFLHSITFRYTIVPSLYFGCKHQVMATALD